MPRVRDSEGREYYQMSLAEDDERDSAFYRELKRKLESGELRPPPLPPAPPQRGPLKLVK